VVIKEACDGKQQRGEAPGRQPAGRFERVHDDDDHDDDHLYHYDDDDHHHGLGHEWGSRDQEPAGGRRGLIAANRG